ncbi:MAG TPA: polyprenyl synthetase family protein [Spirochaetes bacterium]|nr:polyprenyl synthetase family protein [Spirochaetota bacterium]
MTMNPFFEKYRASIEESIIAFLTKKKDELSSVNIWGEDLMRRFSGFAGQGKMIRGGLVILSYLMYKGNDPGWIVKTASAVELIHSSLLIHDDIMDRDYVRRGEKTLFAQYQELGENEKYHDPVHFGESFGICAGDIGFFLAFEILSEVDIYPEAKGKIFNLWSKELTLVGLAQMQDVYFSISNLEPGEDEILDLYRFKTARYTFSLPLMTGAILAGQDTKTALHLEKLGECIGIIFQIKDDELGLFGDEKEIGKPVGTDIEEGKKTIYSHYLLKSVRGEDRKSVQNILHQKINTKSALETLRDISQKAHVHDMIRKKILSLSEEAKQLIYGLNIEVKYREILLDILEYNINRER